MKDIEDYYLPETLAGHRIALWLPATEKYAGWSDHYAASIARLADGSGIGVSSYTTGLAGQICHVLRRLQAGETSGVLTGVFAGYHWECVPGSWCG